MADMEINDYGVCRLALTAVRHAPHAEAIQVNQLLFGDHYEVTKKTENEDWVHIKIHFDGSEGWIDCEQHHSISKDYFDQINHANFKITTDLTCNILFKKSPITILLGSIVPISNSELFKMEEQFAFNGEAKSIGQKREMEFVKSIAMKYLNAPHLPGGKSPFGIDAPGFVQMVFKIGGYSVPHAVQAQLLEGKAIATVGQAQPGDLAFFSGKDESISHVGIIIGEEKVIHSHGRVRVDVLTEAGIINTESKKCTHSLKEIRRIVNPA
jgi:gamma-D-glutamyl-L-lysine dipeptidyl-peptidase